jgi:hypothetical protein
MKLILIPVIVAALLILGGGGYFVIRNIRFPEPPLLSVISDFRNRHPRLLRPPHQHRRRQLLNHRPPKALRHPNPHRHPRPPVIKLPISNRR